MSNRVIIPYKKTVHPDLNAIKVKGIKERFVPIKPKDN